jgi:hypothetical protein
MRAWSVFERWKELEEEFDKLVEEDPTREPFVEAFKVMAFPVHKGHHWMTQDEMKAYCYRVFEVLSALMNK